MKAEISSNLNGKMIITRNKGSTSQGNLFAKKNNLISREYIHVYMSRYVKQNGETLPFVEKDHTES